MKKAIKITAISILFVLILTHWYYGTTIFTKYSYIKFNENIYANNTLKMWLQYMVDNKRNTIIKYWPNDTITAYSSGLSIENQTYKGISIKSNQFNNGLLPFDSSWIRIELDFNQRSNLSSYTFSILGLYYDSTNTNGDIIKQKYWAASFVGRRYCWFPNEFVEMNPNRFY